MPKVTSISDQIRRAYTDMYAGGTEKAWRDAGAKDKAANIVRAWAKSGRPAPRVVEVGCGDGAIADRLAWLGFFRDYAGYDISRSGIDEAKTRGVPNAGFACIEGQRIPVADDATDLVVMSHVIEHLEHPRFLVYEALRIAPYAIVEVPLELNGGAPHDYVIDALGHINKYNALSIRHFLQSCGAVVLDRFTTNPSLEVQTFQESSLRTRAKWLVKEASLRAVPVAARSRFTYHETVLLRRS